MATQVAPLEDHSSATTLPIVGSLTAKTSRHAKLLRVIYLDQTLLELTELILPVRARAHALERPISGPELERLQRLERLIDFYRAERKELAAELHL